MNGNMVSGLAQGFQQGYDFMDRAESREQNRDIARQRASRQEQLFDMQKSEHARRLKAMDEKERSEKITRLWSVLQDEKANGGYDPQTVHMFLNAAGVTPQQMISEDTDHAAQVLSETAQGTRHRNSPESLTAVNYFMDPMLNRDDGHGQTHDGHDIHGKKIIGMYPSEDGKHLGFQVHVSAKDKQGNDKSYQAPVTRDRSAHPDDPVLEVPVKNVMDRVVGVKMARDMIQNDPDLVRQVRRIAIMNGVTPNEEDKPSADWRISKLDNGRFVMYNQRTGERKYPSKEEVAKMGGFGGDHGGGSAPADVQTAQWLMDEGVAASPDEAWQMVQTAVQDPADFVSNYVDRNLKIRQSQALAPSDDGYRTEDEMIDDGLRIYRAIQQRSRKSDDRGLGSARSKAGTSPKVYQPPENAPQGAKPIPAKAIEAMRTGKVSADQVRKYYGWLPQTR